MIKEDNDYYKTFFEKQRKGTVTTNDIPIICKMNDDEELTDTDLMGYLLMLNMGLIE